MTEIKEGAPSNNDRFSSALFAIAVLLTATSLGTICGIAGLSKPSTGDMGAMAISYRHYFLGIALFLSSLVGSGASALGSTIAQSRRSRFVLMLMLNALAFLYALWQGGPMWW